MNNQSFASGRYDNLRETFKTISYDSACKEYMNDSEVLAYNFDKIKQEYTRQLHCSENKMCSVDAIWITGDKVVFVEFKNGRNFTPGDLRNKMKDSLLLYCDLNNSNISKTRFNAEYVVVYSRDKRPIRDEETLEDREGNEFRGSENKYAIARHISLKARTEFIRWGLAKYIGIYFADVHTYEQEEFERYLQKNVEEMQR